MKFECEWGSVEYHVDRYGAIYTGTKNFIADEDIIDSSEMLVSAFAANLRNNHRKTGEITPVYIAIANGDFDRAFVRGLINEGFYIPGTFNLNYYL